MKANSRRRVLISSIAMLLVALVALSTATFAWFTSSTTATASGINVRTAKASKLQISSAAGAWGTQFTYEGFSQVMLPTSSHDGSAWYSANAAAANSPDAEVDKNGNPVFTGQDATDTTYLYKEQLNIRNAGEADVKDIKITFALPHNYARVALVPTTGKGADYMTNTADDFRANIYANNETPYYAVDGGAISSVAITPESTCEITISSLAGLSDKDNENTGGAAYYNLYVWFEGQDADCIDNNAGTGLTNLTFSVTGTTVVEQG